MKQQTSRAPLILNVEDREGPRYVKSRILHRGEFSVIEAVTGHSALSLVRQHAPALVLLSARLPDISGLEVCRLLKDDPQTARTLVLLTSPGLAQPYQRVEALNCGADSYLVEPAEPEELLSSIQALLRLRDEEQRKDQFLAMLAHELRSSLAPLRSAADLLQQPAPTREDMFRARDIIGRQVHHLTRLVDELLDISRFNQGRITLRQDLVDLRTALSTAVEAVRPVLDAYRHTLRLSLPEQPLPVRGDLVRLTQIFSNLLQNAAAYTPAGGEIAVDASFDDSAPGAAPDAISGGHVMLRVRDNGAGLSEALQRQLFDPLTWQDEGACAEPPHSAFPHDGPGIGLTLVQKLVRLHGGTIRAYSAGPGQGSTFTVMLPVEPWQNWHPGSGKAAPRHGVPRRVMVVDDNVDALEAMTMTLQTLGHTVVTAPDGPSALARAADARPEVVLLDLGMPAMDGFETARRLRALPGMRGATLVALSGFGQPEDRRRALEAGFDRHLVKPADLDALARLLDELDAGRA